MTRPLLTLATALLCVRLYAADPVAPKPAEPAKPATPAAAATPRPQVPPPTLADVPYGQHPKQVLDFYKAESDKPTPLVFMIHGGGWTGGSKSPVGVAGYLKAGISVVSIEYRFIPEATADGVKPPVAGPLGAGAAICSEQGQGMEHRQDADRGDGRFGGRVLQSLAGLSSRPGGREEQRSHRA
jgi:hypothetical protein